MLRRLDSARHLRDVLTVEQGFAAYLQFASREFSGERPLFWRTAGELLDVFVRKPSARTSVVAASPTVRSSDAPRQSFTSVTVADGVAQSQTVSPVPAFVALNIAVADAESTQLRELYAQSQQLFARFLADNAPFHVPLPPSLRRPIERALRLLGEQLELQDARQERKMSRRHSSTRPAEPTWAIPSGDFAATLSSCKTDRLSPSPTCC